MPKDYQRIRAHRSQQALAEASANKKVFSLSREFVEVLARIIRASAPAPDQHKVLKVRYIKM